MAVNVEDRASLARPISITLAVDHGVVRGALRKLLESESDFDVVAEADNAESAARRTGGHKPDILILDLNDADRSALSILPKVVEDSPETKIIVLTHNDGSDFVRAALETGVHGFILEEAAEEEFVRAVRLVAAGEKYLQPSIGARLVAEGRSNGSGKLSDRETEVLRLIALGYTNSEIAGDLSLSVRTVESHRAHIQTKLGLGRRRSDLVQYAIQHDLI